MLLGGKNMVAINPLPSFIRASAQDAGNMSMRAAGRAQWNDDDWNAAAATQERLIRACYSRASDHNQPDLCYIRFSIAEQLQKRGDFHMKSDLAEIHRIIDKALEAA